MAAKKKLTVEEQTRLIAHHIVEISWGMRRALSGALTRQTIMVLIQHKTKLSHKTIREVLEAAESLEDWCIKKPRRT